MGKYLILAPLFLAFYPLFGGSPDPYLGPLRRVWRAYALLDPLKGAPQYIERALALSEHVLNSSL